MKPQGKRTEVKNEKFKKEFCLKQKKLRADKIRKKYLRLSQVFRKCHMNQPEKIQSKLKTEDPSIVIRMQRSSAAVGFLLSIPVPFCEAHLPAVDTIMLLETEAGELYEVKYLPRIGRLSAGWRKFAVDKHLEVGDDVVFKLVEPTKFKVSVLRENSANEVKFPVHVLHSVNRVKSNKANKKPLIVYRRGGGEQIAEKYNPISPRLRSKTAGCSLLPHKEMLFSNITSFEEFKASLHGLLQNHEVPYGTLQGYYELCCSQNAFLHADLLKGINPKLKYRIFVDTLKKIISNIVSIADALTTCKLSTFLHKYEIWEQTLNSYAALGANVGFLLTRLHHLKSFAMKAEAAKSQYKEACHERWFAENEVKKLEVLLAQLLELKAAQSKPLVKANIKDLEALLAEFGKLFYQYDAHINALKLEVKSHELKFKEEVESPWLDHT